jgi:large subunit ribosomal protein L3
VRECRTGLLGRKVGSTQVFDPESGTCSHVTVIQAGPCRVTQVKTREVNGYSALQLGFDEVPKPKVKRISLPRQGQFKKAGVPAMRVLREVRLREDSEASPGDTVTVDVFKDVKRVDVVGTSKGRGFSGCIRRWGFGRGPMTHGSKNVREPGSTGGKGSVPAKVVKGKKMAGQYGNARRTVRNLEVVKVDPENHVLLVKGAVPGPRNGLLVISDSIAG